ncbi:DUF1731 domain-containing protein [Mucilaginibacter yixingensis]|nr:DUF1731 domain-containing protein [Mucilaginibacter yixingensis]
MPARLLGTGYRFKYPQLKEAVDQCMGKI